VRVRFVDYHGHVSAEKTPSTRRGVREFAAAEFVASAGDTLYALSKEGTASAGPLTTALHAGLKAPKAPRQRRTTPVEDPTVGTGVADNLAPATGY